VMTISVYKRHYAIKLLKTANYRILKMRQNAQTVKTAISKSLICAIKRSMIVFHKMPS